MCVQAKARLKSHGFADMILENSVERSNEYIVDLINLTILFKELALLPIVETALIAEDKPDKDAEKLN